MNIKILMLLVISAVSCFGDAFKADSGTFGTATASTQMDNQGNYRQTNTITHAHITLGTNGHIWAVDQYGTKFQYFTNGITLTWTNGDSVELTNGYAFASRGLIGDGSALFNVVAAVVVSGLSVTNATLKNATLSNGTNIGTSVMAATGGGQPAIGFNVADTGIHFLNDAGQTNGTINTVDGVFSIPAWEIDGARILLSTNSRFYGSLQLNGANISTNNAADLTGPLPLASLPAGVVTNNEAAAVTLLGGLTAINVTSDIVIVTNKLILNGGANNPGHSNTISSDGFTLSFFQDGSSKGTIANNGTFNASSLTINGSTAINGSRNFTGGSGTFSSTITATNGFITQLRSTNGNYTCVLSDENVLETSSSSTTVTLPTAVGNTGKQFVIKNVGSGVCTVGTTSSQNIDGATTKALTAQYSSIVVRSDGTQWWIVAEYGPSLSLAQNLLSHPNTLVAGVGMMLVCVGIVNTHRKRKRLSYLSPKQIEA